MGGRERGIERARASDKSTRALPRDAPRVSHVRQPRSLFYYIKILLTPTGIGSSELQVRMFEELEFLAPIPATTSLLDSLHLSVLPADAAA